MSKKLVVVDSETNKIVLLDNVPSSGIQAIVDYDGVELTPDVHGVVKLPNYVLTTDFESALESCIVSLSVNNNGDINYNNGASSGPYVLHLKHKYTHYVVFRESYQGESWDYMVKIENTSNVAFNAIGNVVSSLVSRFGVNPIPIIQLTNGSVYSKMSSLCKILIPISGVPDFYFNDMNVDVGSYGLGGEIEFVSDRVVDENGNVVN